MIPQTLLETTSIKLTLTSSGFNIKNEIKKSLNDNTVIGFFCLAPSVVRKAETIKNIQALIASNNLPLTVEDTSQANNQIKILFVDVPSFYEYGNAVTKIVSADMCVDVQQTRTDNAIRLIRDRQTVLFIMQNGRKITEDQFNDKLSQVVQQITKAA